MSVKGWHHSMVSRKRISEGLKKAYQEGRITAPALRPETADKIAMTRLGFSSRNTKPATQSPSSRDLEWAAGFLEGEGYFSFRRSRKGRNGGSQTVTAVQVNPEPVHRLLYLFGGRIYLRERPVGSHRQPYFTWIVNGARARGVMMTLYMLMSPKRKAQIERALENVKSTTD